MRLKTYTAPDMATALEEIRQDLGSDAVIVSSLEEGSVIRVTAAVESASVQEPPESFTILDTICRSLEYHGIDMETTEKLIALSATRLDQGLYGSFAGAIEQLYQFAPLPDFSMSSGPLLLVGPPGVGKSVTLAKLALRATLSQAKVHVITSDTLKAGAVSQLTSYADALALKVDTAPSPSDLGQILKRVRKQTTVLIDTPGINPFLQSDIRLIAEIILMVRAAPVLVLPAGWDAQETADMVCAFQEIGAQKMIMTRMDATRRFGNMIQAGQKMTFMAYSQTPYISGGIQAFTSEQVAHFLLDSPHQQRTTHYAGSI